MHKTGIVPNEMQAREILRLRMFCKSFHPRRRWKSPLVGRVVHFISQESRSRALAVAARLPLARFRALLRTLP
jgi:hypothetical protein